jgi:amino acid adenylation domain-containing protein
MTFVADLSSAKRALLAKRLKGSARTNAGTSFVRADVERGAALSFAQQRLWFLDQFEPGRTHYNISKALRLRGSFDAEVFRASAQEIVRRHEILRTVFVLQDGVPVQKVRPAADLIVPIVDLQGLAEDELQTRVAYLARRQAQTHFDLSAGPLFRAVVLRLSRQEHMVIFTVHHIVYDAWSESILVRELGQLYQAFERGGSSPLPELSSQYADFAQWQRHWLEGGRLEQQLSYWTSRLAGAPSVLALPLDRPRPAIQTHNGAAISFSVSPVLEQGLHAVARRYNATLFMVLLSAFNILLARCSGQRDICVGTPVAGRRSPETEALVGCFANTLVMRTELVLEDTFARLLEQVSRHAINAYDNQDVPFERIVDALKPERRLSHSPIFQTMLVLQSAKADRLALSDVEVVGDLEFNTGVCSNARYDLTVEATEHQGRFWLIFEYNTDLFDRETIARMSGQFVRLLEAIVAHPEQQIGRLALLDDAERALLLRDFNATAVPNPQGLLVHQLFEQQVRRTPHAVALVFEGGELSFEALNAKANRLARHLVTLGIKPDDRAAICMERSIEMVVALLGTLKAGAAYVPLEPDYPPERLTRMLRDAAPVVLLVHGATKTRLSDNLCAKIVVDEQQDAWSGLAGDDLDPASLGIRPHHLAYVIYTSGSTGLPKGAMNQHDGVVNQLLWAQQQFALTAEDKVLQKTPFGFDVSVWEFFVPLLAGAQLVMARPGGHQDPTYLADTIERYGVSVLHFVPSMLQAFLDHGRLQACRSVRHLLCIGEALTPALQERCLMLLPQVQLHNLYGPAEAAVDVTYWHCRAGEQSDTVPIGRPIANTQIHILDEFGQPAPIGVVGELYIGGAQVGRGYLNRKGLTAERFIPDPFSNQPGARLYRTGDLARYRRNGVIEYCGRNDFQVKLRGFRIELGEIEAVLAAQQGVNEAIVVARQGGGGRDKRLVAYLRCRSGQQPGVASLRQALAARLPNYMIPAHFVVLDAFPLSPNGKLDRNALPAPEHQPPTTNYQAPRTPTQKLLGAIWAEVLKIKRVGINDNFFELGGHSLLAIELGDVVGTRTKCQIKPIDVFQYPTVKAMAEFLNEEFGFKAAHA